MNVSDFENSPVGTLIPFKGVDSRLQQEYDHWAFIPSPLPYELTLSNVTHKYVAEASREIGRLQTALDAFPNPTILQRTSLAREAQSTSALEGTYAPLESVFEGEYLLDSEMTREQREVLNYMKAAKIALETIERVPIRVSLLSDLQGLIVDKTKGGQKDKGVIRTTPVIIGNDEEPIEKSRFIPPPPGIELETGMVAWEEWLNHEHGFASLVTIALCHYQFETLHPYHDGNGRVGRLVISMQLKKNGLLLPPILNLSAYLNARKEKYKDELLEVSKTGDFDRWIQFFAQAVISQSQSEIQRIQKLEALVLEMEAQIKANGGRGLVLDIPRVLMSSPYFTITDMANALGNSYPAVKTALEKLVSLDIVREIAIKGNRKLFVSVKTLLILRED